ncbi:unnamed protein product, partial [Musa hybrid cultivar]
PFTAINHLHGFATFSLHAHETKSRLPPLLTIIRNPFSVAGGSHADKICRVWIFAKHAL